MSIKVVEKVLTRKTKNVYFALLWMSPALLLVVFATIYPLVFSIDYSLYKTNIFIKQSFVGFGNYMKLFTDSRFVINLINSFIFTFAGIIITYILGFILALLLRKPSALNSVCRTILLIPWIINEVVLALMWVWILNTQMSPVYYFAEKLGIQIPDFLTTGNLALWTVTVLNAVRSLGFSLVMLLAAFSAIPKEVEEASEIDGCGQLHKIWHIFLPLIRPVSLVVLIVLTISFFNIVTLVLTMTGGGPVYATEILPIRLYKEGFIFFNINMASTLTTFMLFINLGLAYVYKKSIKSDSYY
jgi:multiple sugar transport system permease protein